MGKFGNGLSWKSFGLCEAQSLPQKLPTYTEGFKPNYSLQLYWASQNFSGVGYIGLYPEKNLGPEGQSGDPTPWHCAEHSQFCAACHFTLVVQLWLICFIHCNFKAHEILKGGKISISVSLPKEMLEVQHPDV